FIAFVLFTGLFFAPLLPGKVWNNAPGSSQSFSTGDQNISCIGTLGPLKTVTSYDHKLGFPVVYSYATTSNISATCGGSTQHAVGGHTSQFNPLATFINLLLSVALAFGIAKLWRKLRAPKTNHSR